MTDENASDARGNGGEARARVGDVNGGQGGTTNIHMPAATVADPVTITKNNPILVWLLGAMTAVTALVTWNPLKTTWEDHKANLRADAAEQQVAQLKEELAATKANLNKAAEDVAAKDQELQTANATISAKDIELQRSSESEFNLQTMRIWRAAVMDKQGMPEVAKFLTDCVICRDNNNVIITYRWRENEIGGAPSDTVLRQMFNAFKVEPVKSNSIPEDDEALIQAAAKNLAPTIYTWTVDKEQFARGFAIANQKGAVWRLGNEETQTGNSR